MTPLQWLLIIVGVIVVGLFVMVLYDLTQRKHAILRNFPIIGHFRYWLEAVGPELRQYIVTDNDEERPFSRDHRRWVYASSKKENPYFGFGTDNDLELSPNHLIIKHSSIPHAPAPETAAEGYPVACARVLGAARGRAKAFRPKSIINISGMSYGSLSANAVEALNRGAVLCGCLHNTGEGGISPHHDHGGELIWQIGTGYFGCRAKDGSFDFERFKDTVAAHSVKAIEIKLSQGAKPGLGGVLPAAKITPEISKIRGIDQGRDCVSPSSHTAFRGVDEMLDFVEMPRCGDRPADRHQVGGRSRPTFWERARRRRWPLSERGVDFIAIDGGEGGTGAAPLVFSDHVALPFKLGFSRVYRIFAERGDPAVGRLGWCRTTWPARLRAVRDGARMRPRSTSGERQCWPSDVSRRSAVTMATVPTGVATQNRWLMRGLDPTHKAYRTANYVIELCARTCSS